MTRDEFRLQMELYRQAREQNPLLSYWLWKVHKYDDGTNKEGVQKPYERVVGPYLDEIVVTPKGNYINKPFDLNAYNSAMLDAWGKLTRIGPEDVVDYLPVIGDIKGAYDIANDFSNGNYLAGGMGLGLTLLPNFIEKPLRNFIRKTKRNINLIKQFKLYNRRGLSLYYYTQEKLEPLQDAYDKIFAKHYLREHPEVKEKMHSRLINKYKRIQNDVAENNELQIKGQLNFLRSFYKYNDDLILRVTNIFRQDPNYTNFIYHNVDLDPLSLEAVDKYLLKQTTSMRGVSFSPDDASKKDIDSRVKQALTVNSEKHFGGDRLNTNGTGIYTSNSGEIADRFSRPMGDVNDVRKSRADVALLNYPYQNDKKLPIELLLSNFRRSIYPYDIFGSPDYKLLARNGFIAKEALYATRNNLLLPAYERVYFAEQPNQLLLNIVDQNTFYTNVNKKGRWAIGGVDSAPELEQKLFEGYRPGNSFGDFVRFARFSELANPMSISYNKLYELNLPSTPLDGMYDYELRTLLRKRENKLNNIYDRLNDNLILHFFGKFGNGTNKEGIQSTSERPVTVNPYTGEFEYGYNPGAGYLRSAIDTRDLLEFTPVGNATTAYDAYNAYDAGDYLGAGLIGAAALLPGAIAKPAKKFIKRTIPEVNPNYVSDKLNQLIKRNKEVKPNGLPVLMYEDAINQRNHILEELLTNLDYWNRAADILRLFGDDYTSAYIDAMEGYWNGYLGMPEPRLGAEGVRASMNAKPDVIDRFNNTGLPAGIYDFEYQINPNYEVTNPITRHELSHYIDFNVSKSSSADRNNSMFAEMKKDLSKGKNHMYPDNTSYYSQGTELKSYMNTLRLYMYDTGLIESIGDKVTTKQIKNAIKTLPEQYNSVKAAFKQFKTPSSYTKWFNKMPLLTFPGATMYIQSNSNKESN